jgi:hypothetical protein
VRTSFHHQPEAQHPNFQLSTTWQADYPIFREKSGRAADITGTTEFAERSFAGFIPALVLTV